MKRKNNKNNEYIEIHIDTYIFSVVETYIFGVAKLKTKLR